MAFSGGVYTLPAGNPVTTNTTIESSWANTTLSDIATALSTCVLKDGTQTLTANIPMSGFKLTGLGAGSSANDSVRMAQLQSSATQYLTGTAGTNTITASATPTLTALAAGQTFRFIPANTNTGATTLQIDSTAATNLFWNGAAMVGGEIRQNVPVEVFYDGTQYQLLGSAAMANVYSVPDVMKIQSAGNRFKEMTFNVSGVASGVPVSLAVPSTGGTIATTLYVASISGPIVTVFTASGTWTKGSGLKSVYVEVIGAGAGGGATNGNPSASGGGGAGGIALKRIAAASLGATEQVTVGAAGAGGASAGNAGANGGTSSFGAHASATGGTGGATGSAAGGSGGLGGAGSSGDVNGNGAPGLGGFCYTNSAAAVAARAGSGGSSAYGGGGRGGFDSEAATGKGAGGSGNFTTGVDSPGGNGTAGIVIVMEFY